MMKLYSADLSPYSARIRMQIYAKGIADIVFELPEHWGMPNVRERFPIGRFPVLDIDGDMMPKSEMIAEYLEETYSQPSLRGSTPRETAHIRTLARTGDIYIMYNMFSLARQTGALSRQTRDASNDGVRDLLAGEVVRNIKALDKFIDTDGFACCGRITLADCGSCLDSSWSRMSYRPPASSRRFRQLQTLLPIGLQSRRTNTRQEC
jgi:glutathione S-transferase